MDGDALDTFLRMRNAVFHVRDDWTDLFKVELDFFDKVSSLRDGYREVIGNLLSFFLREPTGTSASLHSLGSWRISQRTGISEMAVNRDKPDRWKQDIAQSVDMFNDWFLDFAPAAYRRTRVQTTMDVEATLEATSNLTDISIALLTTNPSVLPTLRMATCPPLAVDRLIGLAGVSPNLVRVMEKDGILPRRMPRQQADIDLGKIAAVIGRMADPDILVWLERGDLPTEQERYRAATIVADRLCGAVANPIIRNAHEERQLAAMATWLDGRGYTSLPPGGQRSYDKMQPGTYSFRMNVPAEQEGTGRQVNMPVDAVVMPQTAPLGELPLLVEAKSAGDFTNVNKRRKEEAVKMSQLRQSHGDDVRFVLFLCGYFDSGYLGYEAAEGIDWVWEHRIGDLEEFGL